MSDDERCWRGRFAIDPKEWCPERGYPPRVKTGTMVDDWLWCGAHAPASIPSVPEWETPK